MVEEIFEEMEENYRGFGFQKVFGFSSEFEYVKKLVNVDVDSLIGIVFKMGYVLVKVREFVNLEMKSLDEESGFCEVFEDFIQNVEGSVVEIFEEEKRIMVLVKVMGDYFYGKVGKDEGLCLFVIVCDFLIILDKFCKEVREVKGKQVKMARKQGLIVLLVVFEILRVFLLDFREKLFLVIIERCVDQFSLDLD